MRASNPSDSDLVVAAIALGAVVLARRGLGNVVLGGRPVALTPTPPAGMFWKPGTAVDPCATAPLIPYAQWVARYGHAVPGVFYPDVLVPDCPNGTAYATDSYAPAINGRALR